MIKLAHSAEELGEEIFKKTQESPDEKLQRITGEIEQKKRELTTLYPSLITHLSSHTFKTKTADNEVLKDLLVALKDHLGSEIQNAIERELDNINWLLTTWLLIDAGDSLIKIQGIRKSAEDVINKLMLMEHEWYPDSEWSCSHDPKEKNRTIPEYFHKAGISIPKHTPKAPHKIQDLYNLVELISLMILQVELLADKSAQKNTSVMLRRRTNMNVSNIQT